MRARAAGAKNQDAEMSTPRHFAMASRRTENMSLHPSEQDLKRFRNRDLSPAEILALDDHLRNCVSCQTGAREDPQIQNAIGLVLSQLQADAGRGDSHLL